MDASIWPVIAAAISAVLIGYMWYHPRVFGTLWMQGSGMTPEMAEHSARYRHVHLLLGCIAALAVAYVLQEIMYFLKIQNGYDALGLSLLVWIGFVVPVSSGAYLWEHRSVKFYFLNISYWLVVLAAMSTILVI